MKNIKNIGIIVIVLAIIIEIVCMNTSLDEDEIDVAEILLNEKGISEAKIEKLSEYSDDKIYIEPIQVTEEMIDEYVQVQLDSLNEIIPINDRKIVREGDVVYVSYVVSYNDEIIGQIMHDNLIVGVGEYNEDFEKTLVGREIGKPFEAFIHTIDKNGEEIVAQFNITVESINYFKVYELTDELVEERFGVPTVEAYHEKCKNQLQADMDVEAEKNAERKLYTSIMEKCNFVINKEQVAQYSLSVVEQSEKIAYVYNMDLETYVNEMLEIDMDEFYQECYDYSEYEIKRYLLISAIFEDLGYEVSDDEYRQKCEQLSYNYSEVREDKYINALVEFSIMEQEVLNYFSE